jgi:hypothetical protein
VAHLDGFGGTPVAHNWSEAIKVLISNFIFLVILRSQENVIPSYNNVLMGNSDSLYEISLYELSLRT